MDINKISEDATAVDKALSMGLGALLSAGGCDHRYVAAISAKFEGLMSLLGSRIESAQAAAGAEAETAEGSAGAKNNGDASSASVAPAAPASPDIEASPVTKSQVRKGKRRRA